ncbi:MAG: Rdx family protein [Acidobacteriaceae bacterium]|nr:Rdx family protein [Acidobacteriaceae bacterium]MBV9778877.1 Rdx family protein [Acidobacteriaceae bacterium]
MSLKNHIGRELHVPIRLRMGAPGGLDVFVDGEEIYSKKKTGRLPTAAELINLIRGKLPGAISV